MNNLCTLISEMMFDLTRLPENRALCELKERYIRLDLTFFTFSFKWTSSESTAWPILYLLCPFVYNKLNTTDPTPLGTNSNLYTYMSNCLYSI